MQGRQRTRQTQRAWDEAHGCRPSGAGPWQRRAGPRRLRAWVRVIARWQPLSSRKTRSRAATPANRSGHPARKLSAPARFGARRPCVAHRPLLTPKRAAICGRVLVSSSQACRVRSRKSSEYAFARPPACQQCRANSTEDGSNSHNDTVRKFCAGFKRATTALAGQFQKSRRWPSQHSQKSRRSTGKRWMRSACQSICSTMGGIASRTG